HLERRDEGECGEERRVVWKIKGRRIMNAIRFGIIGSGSWATALAKILTDNKQELRWWVRNERYREQLRQRGHNPAHLTTVQFEKSLIHLPQNLEEVISESDLLLMAVPSAYLANTLSAVDPS